MSKRNQRESRSLVPAYIVTYSDIVTLLLTFFVLLLGIADKQNPELFGEGRKAFVGHIDNFGLDMLMGKKVSPELGYVKNKYNVSKADKDPAVRTIDAKREETKRIFKKVTKSMTAEKSKLVAKNADFKVTNISFASGQTKLNEDAKKFLTQFAANLEATAEAGKIKIYVLGTAKDEKTNEKQWILSAQRAQSVADFLADSLPANLQCPVYSWGAGPGGSWVTPNDPVSEKSQIMISILRKIE